MSSLSFELAQKLKAAGFPNSENWGDMKIGEGRAYYFPSLSELIEAVGKRFFKLEFHERDLWSAESNVFTGFDTLQKGGYSTPEEAVALLYLALHEKSGEKCNGFIKNGAVCACTYGKGKCVYMSVCECPSHGEKEGFTY